MSIQPPQSGAKRSTLVATLDADLLKERRRATTGAKHVHAGDTDNISIRPEHGTGKAYTLDRLEREAPALFAAVCAGEQAGQVGVLPAGTG
jgi:hypothetical protein